MAASSGRRNFFDDDNEEKTTSWAFNDDEDEQGDLDDPKYRLQQQKKQIAQRTLQSTDRSMALIVDSERTGVKTAEELLHQREQLERVDKDLDKMKDDLKTSQRHITSIKSVWGAIGNYFKKEPPKKATEPDRQTHQTSTSMSGLDRFTSPSASGDTPADRMHPTSSRTQQHKKESWVNQYESALDANLRDMSAGMSRLKGLAQGMNDEITEQNELIDRIDRKTEVIQPKIDDQTRQMKRILK